MWLRGELPGWLEKFRLNADYAEGELAASQYGPVIGHLLRAFPEDGRGAGMVTVATLVVVLLAIPRSWRPRASDTASPVPDTAPDGTPDAAPTAPDAAGRDHLPPRSSGTSSSSRWPSGSSSSRPPPPGPTTPRPSRPGRVRGRARRRAALRPGHALACRRRGRCWPATSRRGRSTPTSTSRPPAPSRRTCSCSSATRPRASCSRPCRRCAPTPVPARTTPARTRSDWAHLKLVCPRFHQYSLEPAAILDLTADCLPRADAVIVDNTVRPEAGESGVERLRRAASAALVATGYDCVPHHRLRSASAAPL